MLFRDPLSTDDVDDEDGSGPSLFAVLGWCLCIAAGLYVWFNPSTPRRSSSSHDTVMTPQAIASIRALPPEAQLANVNVEAFATEADVVCETLEPLDMQLQYASVGGTEVTTRFWAPRPERLHIHSLEGLKPDTEYRFQVTSIELGTGVPRVSRRGTFRTAVK